VTLINKTVSHYRILSTIGAGGMATVYLADDLKHGRRVAIKVMNASLGTQTGATRFQREIEIAARLSHPHILPLHDSGIIDDQPFYVMPHVEGESLRDRIRSEGQLPVDEAVRLATQIGSALEYAHERGLIHRDIKPENILLSDGIALVADFGIARSTSSDQATPLTLGGAAIGTPAYMSPEQIEAKTEIDARADLYSLGCVLYEMLAGTAPFNGPIPSLVHQHVSVQPKLITESRRDVPTHVVEAIAKSLSKSPASRHSSAAEFIKALNSSVAEVATISFAASIPGAQAPNNLPTERNKFIGRTKELAECAELLSSTRLVVMTGLGGSGKTRLAIKLAENLLHQFSDGTLFVDLAPVTDGSRVLWTVAQSVGVREEPDKNLNDLLSAHLSKKKMLVVLDNCEHLLSACAVLVDQLLNTAPRLRIIATSREALGVQGERIFAVKSLSVPDANSELEMSSVESADAVKLFVDRAQIAHNGFALTKGNVAAVVEICRRLDGIPLAIELAAARVRLLSIEQIRTKLDDRFKLLSNTSKSTSSRHQTLRAAIEWSYEQLPANEQELFRMLSVFAGGWTLDLATSLKGVADEFEVLDLLSHLVDKSLVIVGVEDLEQRRYRLLETVREYAFERLTDIGETEGVRIAHLRTMLSIAELAYADRVAQEESASERLSIENDNVRAALEFARTFNAERYLDLVGALAWFWIARSHLFEGHHHLAAALASSDAQPARPSRARALWGLGHMLALKGDAGGSRPRIQEALSMWRELGDTYEIALALESIGWTQFMNGDDDEARSTFEECLRLQRASGNANLINRAMVGLTQMLVALGRTEEARPMAHEILAFSKTQNDKRSEHFGWHYLADCALIQGYYDESLGLYQKSLVLADALGDRIETSFEVQGVAMSLSGLGRAKDCLELAAAVKAEWDRLGADLQVRFWTALLDQHFGRAKQDLGPDEAATTWNEGRGLSFEQAVTMALSLTK